MEKQQELNMKFEEKVKNVERDLVVNMALSFKYKRMNMKEAKKLAKEFVANAFQDEEELFQRLYILSDKYKEARKVYVKYAPQYYQEKDEITLREVRAKYGI